jgi:EAL domain-containing protein (putative c-di-GMP-specific phosphodiesterase class I)
VLFLALILLAPSGRLLKIDRSFITGLRQDIDGTSKDAEIVPAMIDLTHALGLKAVAEGVETSDQLARLRDMGCDFAQGTIPRSRFRAKDCQSS